MYESGKNRADFDHMHLRRDRIAAPQSQCRRPFLARPIVETSALVSPTTPARSSSAKGERGSRPWFDRFSMQMPIHTPITSIDAPATRPSTSDTKQHWQSCVPSIIARSARLRENGVRCQPEHPASTEPRPRSGIWNQPIRTCPSVDRCMFSLTTARKAEPQTVANRTCALRTLQALRFTGSLTIFTPARLRCPLYRKHRWRKIPYRFSNSATKCAGRIRPGGRKRRLAIRCQRSYPFARWKTTYRETLRSTARRGRRA